MMREGWRGILVLVLLLVTDERVFAAGFAVYEQGAAAMGQGGAFSARADNPSAIFYNPAGIAQLEGTQLSLGATAIIVNSEFMSNATGNKTDMLQQITFPPNVYVTHALSDRVSLGFGIFAPFGLKTRWSDDWELRRISYRSSVESLYFNPTIAWRLSDRVMLGMGIDYVYATLELRKRVINPFPPPAEADLNLHKASGDGWGYNFGALIGLTDSTTLGLSFRSLVNLHIEGDADFSAPISVLSGRATTNLKMPPVAVIGLSHYFSPNLALEVDAQWTGWSSFQSLEIAFENPLASAPPIPRGWRDVFAIRMGGEYRVNDRLALRAGYIFDETPVPNDTVDPVLQDSTRDNLAVGMGYTVGSWTTDVAYNAFFLRDRKVDNVVTGVTQQGTYETLAHLIGVNLTYRF